MKCMQHAVHVPQMQAIIILAYKECNFGELEYTCDAILLEMNL